MKLLKFFAAWFNYRLGWFFTHPNKLEKMGEIYKEEYEQAKKNLKNE